MLPKERTTLIKVNIIAGAIVKGMSILCSLLLIPLTINYISSELYGIWLTLSSVVQWMGFFDIGFGNGLRNKLAESVALGDFNKGRIYVSTTYAVLLFVFLLLGIVFYNIASVINWASFLNISDCYNSILIKVAQILSVAFSCQMVLKLIQNVLQSFQLNALSSFLDAMGNIVSLVLIYILTITMAPDLVNIALAFSIAPILVFFFASLALYFSKFRKVLPSYKCIRLQYAKDLLNLGGKFFVIQIAAFVLYQTINVLISRLCGPEQVTNYNVAYKYLSVVLMVVNIIVAPMWSAFTDAYVKKDVAWMKRIYHYLLMMFFVSVALIIVMVALSPIIYELWIGPKVRIALTTSSLVGIYMIIAIWGQIHGTIINGIGKVKFQLYYSVLTMIVFIPLAMTLGHFFNLAGILVAMILVNLPGLYYGRYQVLGLINNNLSGIWNK